MVGEHDAAYRKISNNHYFARIAAVEERTKTQAAGVGGLELEVRRRSTVFGTSG